MVLAGVDVVSDVIDEHGLPEGAKVEVQVNRYERDPVNRMRCIQIYGSKCWVCDTDFEAVYGPLGQGYIVVHHIIPVSKIGANYVVSPRTDLVPLCPNCHAMVHRTDPPVHPRDLRKLLGLSDKQYG